MVPVLACSPSLTSLCQLQSFLTVVASVLHAYFFFFLKETYICKSVPPSEQKHQPGLQHRRQWRVKQCQATPVKGKQ